MAGKKKTEGWLFDAYTENDGIRLWIIERNGEHISLLDRWHPSFLVGIEREPEVLAIFKSLAHPVSACRKRQRDLFTGEEKEVIEVRVPPPRHGPLVRRLKDAEHFLYNADIHPVQAYHYDRGHFPLAFCLFEHEDGVLQDWTLQDDVATVDYELPPLRTMSLRLSGSEMAGSIDPNHAPRGVLQLEFEGQTCELEGPLEEQMEGLRRRLIQWDPDVLATEWGDDWLLPKLLEWSEKVKVELPLSRDPKKSVSGKGQRTYYTYGRAVYQHGITYLHGRWHLDYKNSFMLRESGLHGLFEIARASSIPVQRAARTTIGTALTSMQMRQALADGVLIPMNKAQAEDFRSASELLVADKGGLAYEAEVGWHENVVEYDFVSMYPTVMVDWNISPETVNCPCCPENKVPEIEHHLCKKRRGIVPKVLEPILIKRARYKALFKEGGALAPIYKARAGAYKWILVCCFGYLGFKNARFGKIEAHECVNAYGREALLRAKESVESRGYHMLHALVDSVWISGKPGMDVEALRLDIEREAGCPVALEGVYRWIRFCPSKMDPELGLPARYFGAFSDGTTKVRGLALRRRDTPQLLKDMQNALLERMAQASGLLGLWGMEDHLQGIVADFRARLRDGHVSAAELAVSFHVGRDPAKYKHDSLNALAAKQLARAGLTIHLGETVRYVIVSAKDPVKEDRTRTLALSELALEYDEKKYLQLLERAAEEILGGLLPAK